MVHVSNCQLFLFSFADAPNQKYRRLQYRGLKTDLATQSVRFKRAYDAKVQNMAQAAVDKEIARAKSVSMIRKYRAGDLPDIQIPYADILKPLQRLAELDVEICRMLFSKLVTGLMNQVDSQVDTVSISETWVLLKRLSFATSCVSVLTFPSIIHLFPGY